MQVKIPISRLDAGGENHVSQLTLHGILQNFPFVIWTFPSASCPCGSLSPISHFLHFPCQTPNANETKVLSIILPNAYISAASSYTHYFCPFARSSFEKISCFDDRKIDTRTLYHINAKEITFGIPKTYVDKLLHLTRTVYSPFSLVKVLATTGNPTKLLRQMTQWPSIRPRHAL